MHFKRLHKREFQGYPGGNQILSLVCHSPRDFAESAMFLNKHKKSKELESMISPCSEHPKSMDFLYTLLLEEEKIQCYMVFCSKLQ